MSLRVLIVDDSPFFREVLRDVLGRGGVEVVGELSSGVGLEEAVRRLDPDVITLDVLMPLQDGPTATAAFLERHAVPILLLSADKERAEAAARLLGSKTPVEIVPKPTRGFDEAATRRLAEALGRLARRKAAAQLRRPTLPARRPAGLLRPASFVAIVASAGGPPTLAKLLAPLTATYPVPCALVQHTSVGFTGQLVSWLGATTTMFVSSPSHGQAVRNGHLMVAPDAMHLEITPERIVRLRAGEPLHGHRPSGDLLLRSVADAYGKDAVAVVLTGMGSDGAEGAQAIEAAGGQVLVEDPVTAAVPGMPRAALGRLKRPLIATVSDLAILLTGLMNKGAFA